MRERLRFVREKMGMNQTDFARMGGVQKQTQIRYESGERMPDSDYLANLHESGVDVMFVLTGQPAGTKRSSKGESTSGYHPAIDDFVMVPRYDVRASAGHGALVHSEQVVDHLAFREEWVRNALGVAQKDLALITVRGDSMEPTLSNGDLILIDMHERTIGDNSIYVIRYDGQLLVKRAQRKLDGTVVIKSDNTAYDPEVVEPKQVSKLGVIGRVVWAGRRL